MNWKVFKLTTLNTLSGENHVYSFSVLLHISRCLFKRAIKRSCLEDFMLCATFSTTHCNIVHVSKSNLLLVVKEENTVAALQNEAGR